MLQSPKNFMRSPGSENEGGNITPINDDKTGNKPSSDSKEDNNKKKPFLKKIKDALQDWSNNDQREQQIDDTRP